MKHLDLALLKAQFGGIEVFKRNCDWMKHCEDEVLDLQDKELFEMRLSDFSNVPSTVTTLLLNNNRLTHLIYDLPVMLDFLKYLNLENNLLTELPAEFGAMINLEYLNISGNAISSLPSSFGYMKSLKCMVMNKTPLKTRMACILEFNTDTERDEGRHCALQMRALAAQIWQARPPHIFPPRRALGSYDYTPTTSATGLCVVFDKRHRDFKCEQEGGSTVSLADGNIGTLLLAPMKMQDSNSDITTMCETVAERRLPGGSSSSGYIPGDFNPRWLPDAPERIFTKPLISLPNIKLEYPEVPYGYFSVYYMKKASAWLWRQFLFALLFSVLSSLLTAMVIDVRVMEEWAMEWLSFKLPIIVPVAASMFRGFVACQLPVQNCVNGVYSGCPLIPYVPPTWYGRLFNWVLKALAPIRLWIGF